MVVSPFNDNYSIFPYLLIKHKYVFMKRVHYGQGVTKINYII